MTALGVLWDTIAGLYYKLNKEVRFIADKNIKQKKELNNHHICTLKAVTEINLLAAVDCIDSRPKDEFRGL